jgi:molybdopterin-binding protein
MVAPYFYSSFHTMSISSLNPRNQFSGAISHIEIGPVISEVEVQTSSGIVVSLVSTRAVKELNFQIGTNVIAFVKATDVALAKLD